MSSNGWIGVDLDGTLAHYDGWKGWHDARIGAPIKPMVERVISWLREGKTVKIFTARISDGKEETIKNIENWCVEHIGFKLEVTNVKDFMMVELWDDRAVQVVPNTGLDIVSYLESQNAR
jgi:hypothetical protein